MNLALDGFDFAGLDIESYLDLRDAAPFNSHWQADFEAVETFKAGIKPHLLRKLEKENALERERVFKLVFRASGSSELAAYLSEDASLLHDAYFLAVEHDFLTQMAQAYVAGGLPGQEDT